MRIVALIGVVAMLPFYALTGALDAVTAGKRSEVSKENIVGAGAYFRSQGITADDEGNLYFSSKTTLVKTDAGGRKYLAQNLKAIPEELSENCGIKHIGGISWFNGKIYCGMEDSKVWDHPIVGVFDAQTLEFVESFELDSEVHTRVLPWVTVDRETGLLYAFDHSKKPTKILVYDINDGMKNTGETALEEMIPSIQGAEFLDGVLYAATNDETQAIYKIDVSTGKSEKIIDRNLLGGEGEGLTVVQKDGKTCLLAMDMGTIFINTFLRWYEV